MAYIKKMVVQGFKSFAKRTEVVFDRGINVFVGPNGSGKSCSYDTLVTLANGQEIEIGKLVEEQLKGSNFVKELDDGIYTDGDDLIEILSLNKETMKIEKKRVSKLIKRDGEILYKIKTRSGKEVKATGCHPVMSFNDGEIKSMLIRDLKEGSLIATPRTINIEPKEAFNKEFARLIGYIIGDGYVAKDRIEFVNNDKEIIEDYKSIINTLFKCEIRERLDKNATRLYVRDKNFVKKIRDLLKLGFNGPITSSIKKIPSEILSSDKETVGNLLAGLFDTDGSVRKDIGIIEFCTKNKDLAHQIQGLLLRFGILSKIKRRVCFASNTIKKIKRDYYYLYIYGNQNIKKFYDYIPIICNHKRENVILQLSKLRATNPNTDLLPQEINKYVKEISNVLGIKLKKMRGQYPTLSAYIENRCLPTREGLERLMGIFEDKIESISSLHDNISINHLYLINIMDELHISSRECSLQIGLHPTIIRNQWARSLFKPRQENLKRFYNFIRNVLNYRIKRAVELINLLKCIARSDIFWDEIVAIEKLEKADYVYDLTIEDNHNFIANNIFVHNSNIMEALCFVLGRLSIKSMRAAKARNLIFMGSKYIRPAKEASVELVFDNMDKAFALDSDEVNLKRIVRSNGQSIYKINEETKTRTEVIEMLAQAGIDPHGFNLIMQGQIQSIIRMHPDDRRKIIEEVAGISIYESRKEKSMHELEKTEERLKEISTILRERTTYLRNLEKEKNQAQRYKDSENTVKRAKASIFNRRLEDKKKELGNIIKGIEEKEIIKRDLRGKIEEMQNSINELADKINEINKHIQKSTGMEQDSLHNEIANLKAELEGSRVRKESYENRKGEIEHRIKEMGKSIPDIEREIVELRDKSPKMAKKAEELKKKRDELAEIGDERKRILTMKNELQSLRERIKDKERQIARVNAGSENLVKIIEDITGGIQYKNEGDCVKAVQTLKESLSARRERHEELAKEEMINEKISSVKDSEIENANRMKAKVNDLDVCPLCQSKITDEHIGHVHKDSDDKIEKAKREKEDALELLKKIHGEKLIISNDVKEITGRISKVEIELLNHRSIGDKKEQLKRAVNEENILKGEIIELENRRKKLEEKSSDIGSIEEKYEKKMLDIEEISSRTEEDIDTTLLYKERELENMKNIIKRSNKDFEEIELDIGEISENIENKSERLEDLEDKEKELQEKFKKMFASRDEMQKLVQERNISLSESQQEIRQIEDQVNYLKIGKAKVDAEHEALEMELSEFVGIELLQGSMNVLEERLKKAQESLQGIGAINMKALEVYDEIKKEYDVVQQKVDTIGKEKEDIMKIIEEIDNKKSRTFNKTFRAINELFSDNFSKLSTKGYAYLEVENKEDIFSAGINIVVKLAKGKYFDVTSLSGGEQTLIALSLLFAIQEHKPYHFYVFDEIDAALDKRNSERLSVLLNQYMKSGQYIVITHNDAIILNSNALYGVSMHDSVSKILSLKLNDNLSEPVNESLGELPNESFNELPNESLNGPPEESFGEPESLVKFDEDKI